MQEAAWGLVCRWRRGDLSVLTELQSARPALHSELGRLMGSSLDVCGLGTLGAGGWKHKGLVGIGETTAAHWDSADLLGVGVDNWAFCLPWGLWSSLGKTGAHKFVRGKCAVVSSRAV